jgi:hypothetical protein
MGNKDKPIAEDRPAKILAEYLRHARQLTGVTYRQMAKPGFCRYNTLSQTVDGRLKHWATYQRFISVLREAAKLAGTADNLPADLEEHAEHLWRQAKAGRGLPAAEATTMRHPNIPYLPQAGTTQDLTIYLQQITTEAKLVDALRALLYHAGYDVQDLRWPPFGIRKPEPAYLRSEPCLALLLGTAPVTPVVAMGIAEACGATHQEIIQWGKHTCRILGLTPAPFYQAPPTSAASVHVGTNRRSRTTEPSDQRPAPAWHRALGDAVRTVLHHR